MSVVLSHIVLLIILSIIKKEQETRHTASLFHSRLYRKPFRDHAAVDNCTIAVVIHASDQSKILPCTYVSRNVALSSTEYLYVHCQRSFQSR